MTSSQTEGNLSRVVVRPPYQLQFDPAERFDAGLVSFWSSCWTNLPHACLRTQGVQGLALPRFSGALRRVLATSVFNAALIVEGELGLLSRGFSAHISAQRLVRLLKSESVME